MILEAIGWRAWYEGKREFSSTTMSWEELPDDGVLAVVVYFNHVTPTGHRNRRIMAGSDWYFKHGKNLFADSNDKPEDILRRYPGASLKRGKWVLEEDMFWANEEAGKANDCGCG